MSFSIKQIATILLAATPIVFAQTGNATNSTGTEEKTDAGTGITTGFLDSYGSYLNESNFNADDYENGFNQGYNDAWYDDGSPSPNVTDSSNSTANYTLTATDAIFNSSDPGIKYNASGLNQPSIIGISDSNNTHYDDPTTWNMAGYQDGYRDYYGLDDPAPVDLVPTDEQVTTLVNQTINSVMKETGQTVDTLYANGTNTSAFEDKLSEELADAFDSANLTLSAKNSGDVCGGYCTSNGECAGKGLAPNGSIEINGTIIAKRDATNTTANLTSLLDEPLTFACSCGRITDLDYSTQNKYIGFCTYAPPECYCNITQPYASKACCDDSALGIVHEDPCNNYYNLDPNCPQNKGLLDETVMGANTSDMGNSTDGIRTIIENGSLRPGNISTS